MVAHGSVTSSIIISRPSEAYRGARLRDAGMPLARCHNSAAETVRNFMGTDCVFDAETAISSAFLRTIMTHSEQRGKTREKIIIG